MEYWIIYSLQSGEELYAGSGSVGTAAYQQLPEGAGIIIVPPAVVAQHPRDLVALQAALSAQVDSEAERIRQRFLTPGAGEAMTYLRKEAEARAYLLDPSAPTPFLTGEAAECGISLDALIAEVITLADAWIVVGSAINSLRRGAKTRIAAATTFGDIVAASRVDWTPVLQAAA